MALWLSLSSAKSLPMSSLIEKPTIHRQQFDATQGEHDSG
jgi:hypothetical protein